MSLGIGSTVLRFDSLESTNKKAAELFNLSKVQHGAVIVANEQTSGRGQRGRTWHSSAGLDLTFSVVLQPVRLRAEDQFTLGKMAALAVSDVIGAIVAKDVRIKWPNDILVDRRKIAGILIKNDLVGELVLGSIIGIGINVNSTDLPDELCATSLLRETGVQHALNDLLKKMGAAMDQRWNAWEEDRDALASDFAERLWSRGRWADMFLDAVPIKARPIDVDRHGRLIMEQEGGGVAAYGLDRLRFAPR